MAHESACRDVEAVILSYGLDTNGQNTRYVRASERWGDSRAVVKALAIGNADPAGVVARFQIAADKLGGLKIRSVNKARAYFDFPSDIAWTRQNQRLIVQLVKEADVIHLNNSLRPAQVLGIRKPMLIHHHGSLFRDNTKKMLADARQKRMVQAVSTIDLQKPSPEVLHWLPTAYDVAELQAFGKAHRRKPDGRVRIVHAPTNRSLKHTDLFIRVVSELQAEGLPIDLVLVEGKTWRECMTIKAGADIVFDQLMYGYGCNAVEAWGMGIPVIAGAEDHWVLDTMRGAWGGLPFYNAGSQTLKADIRLMVESSDLRAEYASTGLAHVRKYHDEKPALAKLAELYGMAIRAYQSGRAIPGKPVQAVIFTSKRSTRVSVEGGVSVQFVKGHASVTDPDLIERLRKFARTRPNFGIEEVA